MKRRFAMLSTLLGFCMTPSAEAGFVVQFDPQQTSAIVSNDPQVIPVDFEIEFVDDGDANTLSSYTFEIADPVDGLSFANPVAGDRSFDVGPSLAMIDETVLVGSFNAAGNVMIPEGSPLTLFTLDFVLGAGVGPTSIPLLVSLRDVNRDVLTAIDSEFSVRSGTFEVSAVPEPGSMTLLTVTTLAAVIGQRRRRNVHSKSSAVR